MKKYKWTSLLFLSVSTFVFGQKAPETKADKLYKDYGFQASLDANLRNLNKQSGKRDEDDERTYDNIDMKKALQLAEAYRLTGDYNNAAVWYEQVCAKNDKLIYLFRWGQALLASGQNEAAQKCFVRYNKAVEAAENKSKTFDGQAFALAAANPRQFAENLGVEVKSVSFNSGKLDFSPFMANDKLYFVSNRGPKNAVKPTDKWLGDNYFDLWEVDLNADEAVPSAIKGKVNSTFHEGSAVVSANGKEMYFSRNLYDGNKKRKDESNTTRLGIYKAKLEGDNWTEVESMPFNNDSRIHCHPALSPDGKLMYMASDRPGGYGGLDIYVSELKGGRWSKPVNLGATVNSAGNDNFPFVHADGTLYFASEGHAGLGGLDIFYTQRGLIGDSAVWSKPVNMGTPFNSNADDFGYCADKENRQGFFTSARTGGKGADDIYTFTAKEGLKKKRFNPEFPANIFVYDAETNQRLPQSKVWLGANLEELDATDDGQSMRVVLKPLTDNTYELSFINPKSNQTTKITKEEAMITDTFGVVPIKMNPTNSYSLVAKKEGYEMTSTKIEYLPGTKEYGIPMKKIKPKPEEPKTSCLSLEGKVINSTYGKAVPNATVTIVNKCTGEETTLTTNDKGEYQYCLECGCDYLVKGAKKHLGADKKEVILSKGDCPNDKVLKDLSLKISTIEEMEEGDLTKGAILELSNVFYDFNKADIRPDATVDLDKLTKLMTEHPSLEVELSSHTDSRGNNVYNQQLSQRRAEAAVQYLTTRGINTNRLSAKGFGETALRNQCTDGVKCTEEEHQLNRRTEVRVTKFNENIKVLHKDNLPTVIDGRK